MKKSFFGSLIFATMLAMFMSCLLGPVFGAMSFTSAFIPKKAGALNMGLSREVWIQNLKDVYYANNTWLDEAEDLSQFVNEYQTLHFAEGGDLPSVYLNRNTDVDSVEPSETPNAVDLDTYDSQNYKIRNINLGTLPYNKITFYTEKSAKAIRLKEALAAAYSFSPTSAGNRKIIIPTTGVDDGTGVKLCTINDVQKLAELMDVNLYPTEGRNLVLTPSMWWQLIKDNEILKGQILWQQKIGIIDPTIIEWYGIKIHKYPHEVRYNIGTTQKAAMGTAASSTIVDTGFVFCKNEVFRASGLMQMTYIPFELNTAGRAHEFGFQHRFKSGFQRSLEKYSAMIHRAPADSI